MKKEIQHQPPPPPNSFLVFLPKIVSFITFRLVTEEDKKEMRKSFARFLAAGGNFDFFSRSDNNQESSYRPRNLQYNSDRRPAEESKSYERARPHDYEGERQSNQAISDNQTTNQDRSFPPRYSNERQRGDDSASTYRRDRQDNNNSNDAQRYYGRRDFGGKQETSRDGGGRDFNPRREEANRPRREEDANRPRREERDQSNRNVGSRPRGDYWNPSFSFQKLDANPLMGRCVTWEGQIHRLRLCVLPQYGAIKDDPTDPSPQFDNLRSTWTSFRQNDVAQLLAVITGLVPSATIRPGSTITSEGTGSFLIQCNDATSVKGDGTVEGRVSMQVKVSKSHAIMLRHFAEGFLKSSFRFRAEEQKQYDVVRALRIVRRQRRIERDRRREERKISTTAQVVRET